MFHVKHSCDILEIVKMFHVKHPERRKEEVRWEELLQSPIRKVA